MWSPDGRRIAFGRGALGIVTASVEGSAHSLPDRKLEQILAGSASEFDATVAPNARAVAYASTQSGRAEVYVAAWPSLDHRRVVSTQGGLSPRWSRDSRELFFWQNQTLMAVTVDNALTVGTPQALFSGPFFGAARSPSFDVATDGRFLMVKSDERAELRQITVVQNWHLELPARDTP